MATLSTCTMSILLRALANRVYHIQFSDDPADWSDASGRLAVAVDEPAFEWLDDGSSTGGLPADGVRRFYRVGVSVP